MYVLGIFILFYDNNIILNPVVHCVFNKNNIAELI